VLTNLNRGFHADGYSGIAAPGLASGRGLRVLDRHGY
jgi:hypothetical protein